MGKNNKSIGIGVIVLVILIIGVGIALMHNNNTNKAKTPKTSDTAIVNNAIVKTKASASLGSYLTDTKGHPLYTYGGDAANISNCTGSCIESWPAYVDTGATTGLPTNINIITRTDSGVKQFTYKGLPLYTFVSDTSNSPTGNDVSSFELARP